MSTEADPERNAPSSNGPPPPKLAKYRLMTGIAAPSDVILNDLKRPGPNIGIYARVINEEKKAQRSYLLVSTVISLSFLGQIIVAATLTALGASNASHIAITVLGSVNTVIAGIQTYLKGQGLPNRVRQYQFGLRKLREYMEDRERDFSDKDCKLNVDHIVEDVGMLLLSSREVHSNHVSPSLSVNLVMLRQCDVFSWSALLPMTLG